MGGGFNSRESFVGEMTQLNVYDEVLLADDVASLANKTACNMATAGNVVAWTDVLDRTRGDVVVIDRSHCLGKHYLSGRDRLGIKFTPQNDVVLSIGIFLKRCYNLNQ